MKLTLDRVCITSGRLCSTCQKSYDDGEISDIDITVGEVLLDVAKSQRYLSDISVNKIIETSNSVYIVVERGDLEKLKQAGEHLKSELKQANDKIYIYLEDTKNPKKILEQLLQPVVPVGNSIVFLPPDSQKELKVKIKKTDKNKLNIDTNELYEIIKALLGIGAHYSFV